MLSKTNLFSSNPPVISGFLSEVHSYGFNGQEIENQITGEQTHTSAEYWMYDSRLGKRWQSDPLPQIYISDYACFGNNPIRMNDILGAQFGDAQSENNAKSAEKAADKRLNKANKELNKLNKQLTVIDKKIERIQSAGQGEQSKQNKLTAKKAKLKIDADRQEFFKQQMTDMKTEIAEMREHEQIFILHYDENLEFETGETTYDLDGNACVMKFSDIASMADELKAGHQLINGEISFDAKTGAGGVLLDLDDERVSFLRSWSMKPSTQRSDLVQSDITNDKILMHTDDSGKQPYSLHSKEKRNVQTHGQMAKDAGDIYWEK